MSAGNFSQTIYQSDAGGKFNIRVQPETLAANIGAVNAAPAGPVDQEVSASVGGAKRGNRLKARTVRLRFTGAAPDGYSGDDILTIPILNPSVFTPIKKGTTGTYLGVAVKVVGKTPEYVG